MAAERTDISAPASKDRSFGWRGSRRDFVKYSTRTLGGALMVGALGAGWGYKDEARKMFEEGSSWGEFNRYTKEQGFEEVEDDRRKELLGEINSFTEIKAEIHESREPDGLGEVTFSVDDPTYIVVSLEGEYDQDGSLPVVTASYNGLDYVVPILQTRFERSQAFALKTVSQGEHVVKLGKTNLSDTFQYGDIMVSVGTPDKLTDLGQAVFDCLPVLGMETELALGSIYNNDAPFFRNGYIYERESDGMVRVAYFEGRTSEDGGVGGDPIRMYADLDRLFDLDHSVLPTLGIEDAKLYELAHQQDSWKSHRIVTDKSYPFGVDPKSVQDKFFYHSVPDHGMVERGLERDEKGELIHNKVYALYPDFFPHVDTEVEVERLRVRKLIAVREQLGEFEREIAELTNTNGSVFTIENFPRQLEIVKFLHEKEEELMSE